MVNRMSCSLSGPLAVATSGPLTGVVPVSFITFLLWLVWIVATSVALTWKIWKRPEEVRA